MLRGGLIRKLGSGLYSWLPMGMRVLHKVERIVREEMDRAGALEVIMPPVQPAELWQETGRWELYGPMMLRIKDRAEREFCYAPTAEEVITDIARRELRSYRQLPVNFYQIQTKFRDEIRPRFGVLRAREFSMKDAYSFDADEAGMLKSYRKMFDAYVRIFTRLGLTFRPVSPTPARSAAWPRTSSRCWPIPARTRSPTPTARTTPPTSSRPRHWHPPRRAPPDRSDAQEPDAGHLHLRGRGQALERAAHAHREGDPALRQPPRAHGAHPRRPHVERDQGRQAARPQGLALGHRRGDPRGGRRPAGYLGPIGLDRAKITVVADRTVAAMSDFICGANEKDFHLRGANWGRDCPEPDLVADVRNVVPGDPSPDGKEHARHRARHRGGPRVRPRAPLLRSHGATFTAEDGTAKPFEMAATASASRASWARPSSRTMTTRDHLARPHGTVRRGADPLGMQKSDAVKAAAEKLYEELTAAASKCCSTTAASVRRHARGPGAHRIRTAW